MDHEQQKDVGGLAATDATRQNAGAAPRHAIPLHKGLDDTTIPEVAGTAEQAEGVGRETSKPSRQPTDVTGLVMALLLDALVTMPAVGVTVGLDASSMGLGVVTGLGSGVAVVIAVALLVRIPVVRRATVVFVMEWALGPLHLSTVSLPAPSCPSLPVLSGRTSSFGLHLRDRLSRLRQCGPETPAPPSAWPTALFLDRRGVAPERKAERAHHREDPGEQP